MKLVIGISEKQYEITKEYIETVDNKSPLANAIANGTPLPEHHGDLIDKGDVLHDIDCDEEMRLGKNVEWVREVIRNAPTIIEATEESI